MTGHLLINEIEDGCRKNMVLSPLSFNAVLSMIAAGSTGLTLYQTSKFLECNNLDHVNSKLKNLTSIASSSTDDHNTTNGNHGGGPVICLANGLWADKQYPLKPSYQRLVERVYKAQAKNVDFVNQSLVNVFLLLTIFCSADGITSASSYATLV
ncbi:serpin-ZX-like [Coffea arabica]|uniref:Serpin-ZX-like n=1 Tax=Coffea arabica TaxID=13443 RepID=A0ABM4W1T7_COFAR